MQKLNAEGAQDNPGNILYLRFASTIFTYLSQHAANLQDAEDLLLEVFIAAFKYEILADLPAERQLAWLYRVARNKVPGQTITVQQYEPLTSSGHVTLTARAIFLKMEGGYPTRFTSPLYTSPLDGHWPFLQIQVNSHIPSGRLFSLHLKGSQVVVDAPAAVHLVYQFTESCDTSSTGIGNNSWEPISTHVLKAPGNLVGCSTKDVHWQYAVSAAGYAIVGGEYPA